MPSPYAEKQKRLKTVANWLCECTSPEKKLPYYAVINRLQVDFGLGARVARDYLASILGDPRLEHNGTEVWRQAGKILG